MLGLAPAPKLLGSQILCRLYESIESDYITRGPSCVYSCTQDPVVHARVRWITVKLQNNPACIKSVKVFRVSLLFFRASQKALCFAEATQKTHTQTYTISPSHSLIYTHTRARSLAHYTHKRRKTNSLVREQTI